MENLQQFRPYLHEIWDDRGTVSNDHAPTESFSSCLLVMDDNHRLDEWIAYHYHILPLRHLVIAVDPHSSTSPTKLLDRWRPYLVIEEWTDTDFTNATLIITANDTDDDRKNKHRFRQGTFYHACIRHLRALNRTWTTFHDIDEFLAMNADVMVEDVDPLMRQPGAILNWTNHLAKNVSRGDARYEEAWYQHFQRSPCITLARALFGAVESTLEEIQARVPSFINATRFDTLRWRYRATPRAQHDGVGKSIMDVSRITDTDFAGGINAHRPVRPTCPPAFDSYNRWPIGIHHYLGSWESYAAREDARKGTLRSYEKWLDRASRQVGGVDDEVREWMAGFVDEMGQEAAQSLLENAGQVPTLSANQTVEWKSRIPLDQANGRGRRKGNGQ